MDDNGIHASFVVENAVKHFQQQSDDMKHDCMTCCANIVFSLLDMNHLKITHADILNEMIRTQSQYLNLHTLKLVLRTYGVDLFNNRVCIMHNKLPTNLDDTGIYWVSCVTKHHTRHSIIIHNNIVYDPALSGPVKYTDASLSWVRELSLVYLAGHRAET